MDSIRSVAFGLEKSSSAVLRDIEKIRLQSAEVHEQGVAAFAPADIPKDVAAIHDTAEVVLGGMKTTNPWIYHTKAILTPRRLKAWFTRKAMIDTQTAKGLKRLAEDGQDARTSALDQVLWREVNASQRHGQKPDFYSPAIRHEVRLRFHAGKDMATNKCRCSVFFSQDTIPLRPLLCGGQGS